MARSRPAVLVIDEDFASAKNSGKKIRTSGLLEHCARSFDITYLAYADGPEAAATARAVWAPRGVDVVSVPSPQVGKQGLGQLATAARTLWRRDPVSVAAWRTEAFTRAVADVMAARSFDVVHCEITQMAWAVPFGQGVPTVLDAHNVEAVIWERLADVRDPARKLVFRDQARKIARFEREMLPRFDEIVCVSEVDRRRLAERYGLGSAKVLPNGVSSEVPFLPPADGPLLLLYPGSLDWRPAQDGAEYLLREILPRVRARIPDVRAAVVGKGPPTWLRDLCAATPGVECHGDVPHMRPYFESAHLVVVPLRVGSGSRLRILEAMAYGRAVVSTTVGAEGLDVVAGTHLDLADTTEDFAAAVCALVASDARRRAYVEAGRRLIEQHYHWEGIGDKLAAVWQDLCARKPTASGAGAGVTP